MNELCDAQLPFFATCGTTGTAHLITLPLFKYSFVTTFNVEGKLLWKHLSQINDLFVVFDHVTTKSHDGRLVKKRVLRIVCGGETLEEIDLEDLVLQARKDESKSRLDATRTVLILVKRPLVAIRYQLPNGQTRRTQLNFSIEATFDTAIRILCETGLQLTEKSAPSDSPRSRQSKIVLPSPICSGEKHSRQSTFNNLPILSQLETEIRNADIDQSSSLPSHGFPISPALSRLDDSSETAHVSPRTCLSDFREISHKTSTSDLRPYQVQLEPTKHPRYSTMSVNLGRPSASSSSSQSLSVSTSDSISTLSLDSLVQMLPPKRELPFSKPDAKRSCINFVRAVSTGSRDDLIPKITETLVASTLARHEDPLIMNEVHPVRSNPKAQLAARKGGRAVTESKPSALTTGSALMINSDYDRTQMYILTSDTPLGPRDQVNPNSLDDLAPQNQPVQVPSVGPQTTIGTTLSEKTLQTPVIERHLSLKTYAAPTTTNVSTQTVELPIIAVQTIERSSVSTQTVELSDKGTQTVENLISSDLLGRFPKTILSSVPSFPATIPLLNLETETNIAEELHFSGLDCVSQRTLEDQGYRGLEHGKEDIPFTTTTQESQISTWLESLVAQIIRVQDQQTRIQAQVFQNLELCKAQVRGIDKMQNPYRWPSSLSLSGINKNPNISNAKKTLSRPNVGRQVKKRCGADFGLECNRPDCCGGARRIRRRTGEGYEDWIHRVKSSKIRRESATPPAGRL